MIPPDHSLRIFNVGAGAAFGLPIKGELKLFLIGEYDRLLRSGGEKGENALEVDLVLSVPFTGNRFVIGPSVGIGEDITVYGVNGAVNIGFR